MMCCVVWSYVLRSVDVYKTATMLDHLRERESLGDKGYMYVCMYVCTYVCSVPMYICSNSHKFRKNMKLVEITTGCFVQANGSHVIDCTAHVELFEACT